MATYDPRLVSLLEDLQRRTGRSRVDPKSFELSPDEVELFVDSAVDRRGNSSESHRDAARRELLASWKHPSPSAYEPPFYFSVLQSRFELVDQVAQSTGHAARPTPLLGTLDTGTVNALCVRAPDAPGYLLLFETQMFAFCNAVADAFVNCLPMEVQPDGMLAFDYSVENVVTRLKEDAQARQWLLAPILSYAAYGNLEQVPGLPLTYPRKALSGMLRISMEFFVVGHEYGHLMARHLDDVPPYTGPAALTGADDLVHSWSRELEADLLGERLALPAAMTALSVDPSVPLMAAASYFLAIDLVDRAVSVLATGDERYYQIGSSHPPAAVRLRNLIDETAGMFAAHQREVLESAVLGARQLARLGEVFWRVCGSRLVVAHNLGVRPWRGWRLTAVRPQP